MNHREENVVSPLQNSSPSSAPGWLLWQLTTWRPSGVPGEELSLGMWLPITGNSGSLEF